MAETLGMKNVREVGQVIVEMKLERKRILLARLRNLHFVAQKFLSVCVYMGCGDFFLKFIVTNHWRMY